MMTFLFIANIGAFGISVLHGRTGITEEASH